MALGNRNWPEPPGAILVPAEEDAELHARVRELRAQGERLVQQLPGQEGNVAEMGCDRVMRWNGTQWAVEALSQADR
jgi:ATP phosphoribosyltransferase regulatory subunit